MLSPQEILYVVDPRVDEWSLAVPLLAAGYDVVVAHSIHQAIVLTSDTEIEAAVVHPSASEDSDSLPEKRKFVNPELRVVLVRAESESNRALPPSVDAATYSETPEEAVPAITAFFRGAIVRSSLAHRLRRDDNLTSQTQAETA